MFPKFQRIVCSILFPAGLSYNAPTFWWLDVQGGEIHIDVVKSDKRNSVNLVNEEGSGVVFANMWVDACDAAMDFNVDWACIRRRFCCTICIELIQMRLILNFKLYHLMK